MREVRALFFADEVEVFQRHVCLVPAEERKPQRRRVDYIDDASMFYGKQTAFGLLGQCV